MRVLSELQIEIAFVLREFVFFIFTNLFLFFPFVEFARNERWLLIIFCFMICTECFIANALSPQFLLRGGTGKMFDMFDKSAADSKCSWNSCFLHLENRIFFYDLCKLLRRSRECPSYVFV